MLGDDIDLTPPETKLDFDTAAWLIENFSALQQIAEILDPTNVTVIASGNITLGATHEILNISDEYRWVCLYIAGLSSDTAARISKIRLSLDNGATWQSTNHMGMCFNSGLSSNAAPTDCISQSPQTMAAAETDRRLFLLGGIQAGLYPFAFTLGNQSTNGTYMGMGMFYGSTAAVSALQILWNGSGNTDAGTFTLLGMR